MTYSSKGMVSGRRMDRGRQTDGQTEGWMEKVTCKVGCPIYK